MKKQEIQILYDYNRWANARTLDASAKLSQEQLTRDLSGSHRSVRDTLTHILAAEWIWLMRWRGVSPKVLFDPSDFPDFASLSARWAEVEREQMDFVDGVTDKSLARVIVTPTPRAKSGSTLCGR